MNILKNLVETIKANPVAPATALLSIAVTGAILLFSSNAIVTNVGVLALIVIGVAVLRAKVLKRKQTVRTAKHAAHVAPVIDWSKIPGMNFLK